jgi:hypothetical protein
VNINCKLPGSAVEDVWCGMDLQSMWRVHWRTGRAFACCCWRHRHSHWTPNRLINSCLFAVFVFVFRRYILRLYVR